MVAGRTQEVARRVAQERGRLRRAGAGKNRELLARRRRGACLVLGSLGGAVHGSLSRESGAVEQCNEGKRQRQQADTVFGCRSPFRQRWSSREEEGKGRG